MRTRSTSHVVTKFVARVRLVLAENLLCILESDVQ